MQQAAARGELDMVTWPVGQDGGAHRQQRQSHMDDFCYPYRYAYLINLYIVDRERERERDVRLNFPILCI